MLCSNAAEGSKRSNVNRAVARASTFAGKLWLLNNRGKTSGTFARPSQKQWKQARVDLTCWIANAGRMLRPSSRDRRCSSSPLIRPCSSFNFLPKTDTPAGSLVSQRLPFLDSFSHDLNGQSVHLVKHLLAQNPCHEADASSIWQVAAKVSGK